MNGKNTSKRKCAVCSASNFRHLFDKHIHNRDYRFIKCARCGFITIIPYPSEAELNDFYLNEYEFSYMGIENKRTRINNQNRLNNLLKYVTDGSLLEIGCGSGQFLELAKGHFKVKGIDMLKGAVELGKRKKLSIQYSSLEDFTPNEKYDVVCLFHVLEHVYDPNRTLEKIHNLLKPNGILYIIVPNNKSLSFKLFGKYWEWLNPPKHLSYFDPSTIKKILNNQGFIISNLTTWRGDDYNLLFGTMFYFASLVGIRNKIFEKSFGKKPDSNVKSSRTLQFHESLFNITNTMMAPFSPLSRLFSRKQLGSEIAVISRKR